MPFRQIVYRLKFGITIFGAQQLVSHGHITVNGKKVDIRSFQVSPGMTIGIKEKSRNMKAIDEALDNPNRSVPEYLSREADKFVGTNPQHAFPRTNAMAYRDRSAWNLRLLGTPHLKKVAQEPRSCPCPCRVPVPDVPFRSLTSRLIFRARARSRARTGSFINGYFNMHIERSSPCSSSCSSLSGKRTADEFECDQPTPYLKDVLRHLSRIKEMEKTLQEIENELNAFQSKDFKRKDSSSLEGKVNTVDSKVTGLLKQLNALQRQRIRDCQTIGHNQIPSKKTRHEGYFGSQSASSYSSSSQHRFESLSSAYSSCSLDNLLNLYGDRKMADAVFEVKEDEEIEYVLAHRAIVAQQSPALKSMLYGPLIEGINIDKPIPLPNCSYSAFQSILTYFYTGKLKLKINTLAKIYVFADEWLIDDLKKICMHHLEVILKPSNAIKLMCKTYLIANPLYQEAKDFVAANIKTIFASEEDYQKLPAEIFFDLLKCDQLFLPELEIFDWAIKWLEAQPEVNQELIDKTMKHIRFYNIAPDDQWQIVANTRIHGMAVMQEKDLAVFSGAFFEDKPKLTKRSYLNRWLWDKFLSGNFDVKYIGEDACLIYWRIPTFSEKIKYAPATEFQSSTADLRPFTLRMLNNLAQNPYRNPFGHSPPARLLKKEVNVQSPSFEMHGKSFVLHLELDEENNLTIRPRVFVD